MDVLPVELVLEIIKYFDFLKPIGRKTIRNLSFCGRWYNNIINNNDIWNGRMVFPFDIDWEFVMDYDIQYIIANNDIGTTDDFLIDTPVDIKYLSMKKNTKITDQRIKELNHLTYLKLSNVCIFGYGFNIKNLKHFEIINPCSISNREISELLNIETIILPYSSISTNGIRNLSKLSKLVVDILDISLWDTPVIPHVNVTTLKYLKINKGFIHVDLIRQNQNLHTLYIPSISKIQPIESITADELLPKIPNIHLTDGDNEYEFDMLHHTSIKILHMEPYTHVSDDQIMKLTFVSELIMPNNTQITNRGIISLPNLTSLNLDENEKVDDR